MIFGEIIPQSTFGRHGLFFGAKTVWITRFFMVVLWPVCYPISIVLDKLLGEELGMVYNRDELRQLLHNTTQVIMVFSPQFLFMISTVKYINAKLAREALTFRYYTSGW